MKNAIKILYVIKVRIVFVFRSPSPSLPKGKGVSPLRGDGRGAFIYF